MYNLGVELGVVFYSRCMHHNEMLLLTRTVRIDIQKGYNRMNEDGHRIVVNI